MNQEQKKEALSNMSLVDVNKILDDYSLIEKKFSELKGKNYILKAQMENFKRLWRLSHAKETSFKQECAALQEIIKGLQDTLELQCNVRDENLGLKNNLCVLEEKIREMTQEHNKKTDALTSVIKSKEDEYKKQIQKMTCDMDVKLKLKEEEMKTSVCKKDEEMEKLRQQLKSLEREKQSELIKQQIEFNAKLAKIQSKPTKMYQDTSAVSHNIYKMKLQHMQEEKNLEIEGLRNRIKDLERQVSSVNDSRLKRRRF